VTIIDRNAFLSRILVAAMTAGVVLAGAGCAGDGEVGDTDAPPTAPATRPEEPAPGAAAGTGPAAKLAVEQGSLAWGDLRLGMTVSEAEQKLARAFGYTAVEGGCGGFTAPVDMPGEVVHVQFDDKVPEGKLLVIRIEGDRSQRDAIVAALRQRVPDLQYRPSRHAADVTEADNPSPLYALSMDPEQVVLVHPEEGTMTIGYARCVD
jgi:hypothetical protein